MLAPLLAFALAASQPVPQATKPVFDGRYQVSIGGRPVAAGTVWVYYFGWGYIDHFEAGRIVDGTVTIHAGPDQLEHDVAELPSNWPTFIIAVEVPGIGWYRTGEFGDFIGDFRTALESMNEGSRSAGKINLAAPVRQTVHARNADGSPRRGEVLDLTTFVWDANHCGRHLGFEDDVRRVRTGTNGDASFVAPLTDLFLTNTFYTETHTHVGRSLSLQEGIKLPAGREHLVQGAWERAAPREFRIRVAFADGAPVTSATLLESEDGHTCDYSNNEFKANAEGLIVARFALEHASDLCFEPDGDGESCLAADEWEELARTGRLTILWPRPQR